MYLFIVFVIFIFNACGGSQSNTVKKTSNKKNEKTFLVTGAQVMQEESYAKIKGNTTRLQAMLSGHYTHYVLNKDTSSKEKYAIWLVNDGIDSIMQYHLPIGDRNKEGHWMYIYHYMTSLPEDPTFSIFLKLTQINRDTIKGCYYKIPDDFEQDIQAILKDVTGSFEGVDFFKIAKQEPSNTLYYVRKTPLHFIGIQADWEAADVEGTPIKFIRRHYDTKPNLGHYYKVGYDENKKYFTRTKGEFYIKKAMVRPDWFER